MNIGLVILSVITSWLLVGYIMFEWTLRKRPGRRMFYKYSQGTTKVSILLLSVLLWPLLLIVKEAKK